MTPAELLAWRRRMGWSQEIAGPMLGRSKRWYREMELGAVAIPREIELAVLALEIAAFNPPAMKRAQARVNRAWNPVTVRRKADPCELLPL